MEQRCVVHEHEQLATIYKSASQNSLSLALLATPSVYIIKYLFFKIYIVSLCVVIYAMFKYIVKTIYLKSKMNYIIIYNGESSK